MSQSIRSVLLAVGAALLIAIGAYISIPIEPVPLTFQTAVLFVIGLTFPVKRAAFTVGLYLLIGAVGFPVFSDGKSGLDTLFGPTGGFLFGFLFITVLISYLSYDDRCKTDGVEVRALFWRALRPCVIGTVVLQVIGIIWGKIYTESSWPDMYRYWLEPFYLNMVVKAILASLIAAFVWKKFDLSRR